MRAQQKDVLFVYEKDDDLPIAIEVDETRLRQILLNLLGNAIKFTDNGGKVTLRVHKHQALLYFEVIDSGVGISAEHLDKIFQPFEQVGDIQRQAEGTGLGLVISQQLVKLMGGEIQVTSELGKGSTFWFELALPFLDAPIKTSQPTYDKIVGYQGKRRKILAVDDKQDNRLVLLNLLEPFGFEVELAENGQEGVNKAQEIQPDAILMDLVMPVKTGFEAVKEIRQISTLRAVPILAVSASVLEMDRVQSQLVGCDGFLPKPVNAKKLFYFLETHLHLKWQYKEISPEPEVALSELALIPPPPKELEKLYELSMLGLMQQIEEQANALEALDEKYSAFATQLREFAQNFDDEQMIAFLETFLSIKRKLKALP